MYDAWNTKYPRLTKGVTGGILAGMGDIIAQYLMRPGTTFTGSTGGGGQSTTSNDSFNLMINSDDGIAEELFEEHTMNPVENLQTTGATNIFGFVGMDLYFFK